MQSKDFSKNLESILSSLLLVGLILLGLDRGMSDTVVSKVGLLLTGGWFLGMLFLVIRGNLEE